MNAFKELGQRVIAGRWWAVAQGVGMALAVLIGIGWTRIPEKHVWQVLCSFLIPVLLFAAVFALQAATMRRFTGAEKRAPLAVGAASLLAWLLVGWFAWSILGWCADQSWSWASFLNSRAPAALRARLLSYEHLDRAIRILLGLLKWVVVPGKLIPLAVDSATNGWRIGWRKVLRLQLDWRWWPAALLAALLAVWLPGYWYGIAPHGTARAQQWAVGLKLGGTYVLVIGCWLLVMAWAAVLMARQAEPSPEALDARIARRLCGAWRWVAAFAGWTLLATVASNWKQDTDSLGFADTAFRMGLGIGMLVLLPVLTTGTMRALQGKPEKPVWFFWGFLTLLAWAVVAGIVHICNDLFRLPAWLDALCTIVLTGVLAPLAMLSAYRAFRLPLCMAIRVWRSWSWWVAVVWAVAAGIGFPMLVTASVGTERSHVPLFYWLLGFLTTFCGLVLLALAADLLEGHAEPTAAVAEVADIEAEAPGA